MEIKINNMSLHSDFVYGVVGNYTAFINIFKFEFIKNNISINRKRANISEKKELLHKVSIVDKYIPSNYLYLTVYDYMKFSVLDNMLSLKDYQKKIRDSLKIIGLGESYLEKRINLLSYVERKMIILATALLSNPDILIFDSFCEGMDLKNIKKILNLVNQLTERYKKIILFCSNDSEFIYKNTKKIILILKDNDFLLEDTNTLFEYKIDILEHNDILIPNTIIFTKCVLNKKGIKLNYNKDIRDLIKDIYKKV